MPGQWLQSADLPGMPIEITDSRDSDGQFCAFKCNAEPACSAYNYAPHGCAVKPACPFTAGCCWLKVNASSADIDTSVPACASSFMMRPPPSAAPEPSPSVAPKGAKNVLYLLVDDFRPDVGPYGADWMVTPALSSLAAGGTTFDNAYCNIAVCSPSRMSFLTGRYPHHTRTWNFVNHFRQADCAEQPGVRHKGTPYRTFAVLNGGAGQCCSTCTADAACRGWTLNGQQECKLHNTTSALEDEAGSISGVSGSLSSRGWTSLPQHFRNNGYLTLSAGKIFHSEEGGMGPAPWDGPGTGMPPLQDPPSWSPGNSSMACVNALAPMRDCASTSNGSDSCSVASASKAGDVPPGVFTFEDRTIAEDGIAKMRGAAANLQATGQPFFLAVGFRKPHLPFRHPGPWNDEYPGPGDIPLAEYRVLDASQPPIAFHQTSLAQDPYTPMPDLDAGTYRRDYYAAISWMDSQMQRVLRELAALGLTNDTLVAVHSDHGWSLGEHGEWEKFTNWEHGTRVPLIFSTPWLPGTAGRRTDQLAELIDVFPSLASLAGVPVPEEYGLDGLDLTPAILQAAAAEAAPQTSAGGGVDGPSAVRAAPSATAPTLAAAAAAPLRSYALSVFPRCPSDTQNASNFWRDNDCMMLERSRFPFMGLSLRTDTWRYTEWRRWNGSALAPSNSTAPVAIELYNHAGDNGTSFDGPWEVYNLAGEPAYATQQAQLAALLQEVYPSWAA